jgi:hypothetical protein
MIIELLGGGGWLPSLWLPAPGSGRLCSPHHWLVQHHHGSVWRDRAARLPSLGESCIEGRHCIIEESKTMWLLYSGKGKYLKGIDRPFGGGGGGGGVESILIRSVFVNWRLGIFSSQFKWPSSQDQQKTIVRCLITSQVTLTGQSHFMLIFVLRKATLPNRINSVQ